MRFLVDECTGHAVAKWLKDNGHDVFSVYDESRGLDDESIINKADSENFIIITNDKDFGEFVFRSGKKHKGIILLRLSDERPKNKIFILQTLLKSHSDKLAGNFTVVTERTVRIIEKK